MQFKSTQIGGSTQGRGAAAAQRGVKWDVRLPLTNQPLVPLAVNPDIVKSGKTVELLTKSAYVDADGYEIEYMIRGVGSSTLVDTDGDIFHKSAIVGMARDSVDLNTLLNHTPDLPNKIAGSVLETEVDFLVLPDGTEHSVLRLLTDIETRYNDATKTCSDAMLTYKMIAGIDGRPRKLGFSVGCLYVDCRKRTDARGLYKGVDVFEVLPVEFSIVSMPANRLSYIDTPSGERKAVKSLAWIENVCEDLMEKGVLPITETYQRKGVCRELAHDAAIYQPISDWMDFGPIDGPRLEKVATYFEETFGIVYCRPRSA